MRFSGRFPVIFCRRISFALKAVRVVGNGTCSTDLEGPGCPRMASRVLTLHAQDTKVREARDLEQSECRERLSQNIRLLEVLGIHLLNYKPSLQTCISPPLPPMAEPEESGVP